MKSIFLTSLFFLFCFVFANAQQNLRLWYDEPANTDALIDEALPLGNGHLGILSDGRVYNETITLNDITMWSGSKQDANKKGAANHLNEIRSLIFAGENKKAEALVNKYFVCKGKGSAYGNGSDAPYGSYQLLGRLHLKYNYGKNTNQTSVQDYRRDLSLDSAVSHTYFSIDGVNYKRTYFTSFADDVIMIRLEADKPGAINFHLSMNRSENAKTKIVGKELRMFGQLNDGHNGNNGVKYLSRIKIKHQRGTLHVDDSGLIVKHADKATIYISAATDFFEKKTTSFYKPDFHYKKYVALNLKRAWNKPYRVEFSKHLAAYQKLFNRASLNLGGENHVNAALPTDERLIAFQEDPTDHGLPVLYFQFGRYLLISSTRPGWLPPNLQGLWANKIKTPWNADYHLNINLQMNYWPLNVTNLTLLNEPFYTLVKGLVKPGHETAKVYYDVNKGWVSHAITNVWGYTAPGEVASWGSANSGSGWVANMLWQHYAFTLDTDYLKKIYPIIKGSAAFYLHSLVEYPNNQKGWLVTAPSSSPENAFKLSNGKVASVCAGPTIDNQIIRELFNHVIEAANILDTDMHFTELLDSVKKRLPPNQIDKNGRLMEWLKPYQLTEPHHRHMSPLWALYPGNEISLKHTPVMAKAARKLMQQRGDISTGWSLAWKINLWARLHKGNHCFRLLKDLLTPIAKSSRGGTYPNMFDGHPPFQIDGNFGGTAGIAEMLVQSQTGYIELLPALPVEWQEGNFRKFRVRGGGEISASWQNGRVEEVTLVATKEHRFKMIVPDDVRIVRSKISVPFQLNDNVLTLNMKKGMKVHLIFKNK